MKDAEKWRLEAACRGMDSDLFFPQDGENVRPAVRQLCAECPVANECRVAGEREHGVWGGLSAKERRRIRDRQHRIEHPPPTLWDRVQRQRAAAS